MTNGQELILTRELYLFFFFLIHTCSSNIDLKPNIFNWLLTLLKHPVYRPGHCKRACRLLTHVLVYYYILQWSDQLLIIQNLITIKLQSTGLYTVFELCGNGHRPSFYVPNITGTICINDYDVFMQSTLILYKSSVLPDPSLQ